MGLRRWVCPGYISRLDRRDNYHKHKEKHRDIKAADRKWIKERDEEKETGEVDKEFDTWS